MHYQFNIRFAFSGFLYKAEVKAYNFEETVLYDVYYSLSDQLFPIDIIQIYRGSVPVRQKVYWRQRMTEPATNLKDPDFINKIGKSIELEEDREIR